MIRQDTQNKFETKRTEVLSDRRPAVFSRPDSIDAMRHEQMLAHAAPLIAAHPDASWMTVGDGGGDGWMLSRLGAKKVTMTNISDARLQTLAQDGLLPDIQVRSLNAEKIDLPDHSVDFVLCKEAFHHFPRAPIAFYEFMRVSRLGVLLLEPIELSSPRPLDILKRLAKRVLRRRSPIYELFEPVGNYIYRVSPREIFRMMAAVQMSWFAVRPFNDFSTPWLLHQPRKNSKARMLFRLGMLGQDIPSSCGLMSPGMAAVYIPTGGNDEQTRSALANAGFKITQIPVNPYTESDISRNFLHD
jgi:ubiquinone/menaquinone biosynthesis C-methylase UbiE